MTDQCFKKLPKELVDEVFSFLSPRYRCVFILTDPSWKTVGSSSHTISRDTIIRVLLDNKDYHTPDDKPLIDALLHTEFMPSYDIRWTATRHSQRQRSFVEFYSTYTGTISVWGVEYRHDEIVYDHVKKFDRVTICPIASRFGW